jgi:Ca2+/Na+ antiporter
VVVVCAAVLALLLAVVCVGSLLRRGQLPFGRTGVLVIAAFSIASPFVIWVRHDGELRPATTVAVVLNAVCLVMLALAYALARRRVRQANRGTPRSRRDE